MLQQYKTIVLCWSEVEERKKKKSKKPEDSAKAGFLALSFQYIKKLHESWTLVHINQAPQQCGAHSWIPPARSLVVHWPSTDLTSSSISTVPLIGSLTATFLVPSDVSKVFCYKLKAIDRQESQLCVSSRGLCYACRGFSTMHEILIVMFIDITRPNFLTETPYQWLGQDR